MKITDIIKNREDLGRFLRTRRMLLNVTKTRLTRQTGLKYDIISNIEGGATDYTITSLLRYWIGLKQIKKQKAIK